MIKLTEGYLYLSDMSIKEQVQSTFFCLDRLRNKNCRRWIKKSKKVSFTRKDQPKSTNSRCCWIQDCSLTRGECKIYIQNSFDDTQKMFGYLMSLLVQGRNWYISPPPRNSKCALLPSVSGVYNLWKSFKSDMKLYVNGSSTSNFPVEKLAALKLQYSS